MTLAETGSAVRVAKNALNNFEMKQGFRQGDALSYLLFNIYGDDNSKGRNLDQSQ